MTFLSSGSHSDFRTPQFPTPQNHAAIGYISGRFIGAAMKSRERVRPKAAKSRRHKRVAPKRRVYRKIPGTDGLSTPDASRLDVLRQELREALEQQRAA